MMDRCSAPSVFLPRLDDSTGPAWVLSEVAEHALVRAALGKCGFEGCSNPHELDATPLKSERRRERRTRFGIFRFAMVVVLVGSSTAAAGLAGKHYPVTKPPVLSWERERGLGKTTERFGAAVVSRLLAQTHRSSHDATPQGVPVLPRQETVPPGEANPGAPRTTQKRASNEAALTDMESESLSASPPEDALRVANGLRAHRRFAQALAKYLEVVREHPDSAEGVAASVAAATLRLEYAADPVGARELLMAQPERKSSIPEAVFLLSRTYRSSGDAPREKASLRKFVTAYPDHPMAAKAARRLAALIALTSEEPPYEARF